MTSLLLSLVLTLRTWARSRAALQLEVLAIRHQLQESLDKDTPIPRPVTPPGGGAVVAIPEVGGLHHRYERHAA